MMLGKKNVESVDFLCLAFLFFPFFVGNWHNMPCMCLNNRKYFLTKTEYLGGTTICLVVGVDECH